MTFKAIEKYRYGLRKTVSKQLKTINNKALLSSKNETKTIGEVWWLQKS